MEINHMYDLQLFAEANTQTSNDLSAEMKTYYGMELLESAKPQLVHNQFAATKGMPVGGGKTVDMPFDVTYGGTRTVGTAAIADGVATFTKATA